MEFPASAPTITSSIWRRIRMATARITRAAFRIDPRCHIRVRRRSQYNYLVSITTPIVGILTAIRALAESGNAAQADGSALAHCQSADALPNDWLQQAYPAV